MPVAAGEFRGNRWALGGLLLFSQFALFPYHRLMSPGIGVLFYLVTAASALVWFAFAGRLAFAPRWSFPRGRADAVALVLLAAGACFLIRDRITAPIAWAGDESYHVLRTNAFSTDVNRIVLNQPWTFSLPIILAAILFLTRRHVRAGWIAAAAVSATGCALGLLWRHEFPLMQPLLPRYPPFAMLVEFACANPYLGTMVEESAHRLPSTLAWLGIGFVAYGLARSRGLGIPAAFALAGCVLTVPALRYHASLVYIDPLVAFWATFALSRAYDLDLRDDESVYACGALLALCGLVKETCIPYSLALFVAGSCGLLMRTRQHALARLGKLGILLFAPYVPQLFLRWALATQPLVPDYSHFANTEIWRVFLLASVVQLGPPLVLLGAAGWLLFRWGARTAWLLFAALTVGGFWFFMLRIESEWIGIARYQLVFVPLLLMGTVAFWEKPAAQGGTLLARLRSPQATWLVLGVVLAWNVSFPVRGQIEREEWALTSHRRFETFYPFDQAAESLRDRLAPGDRVRIDGLDYPYFLRFYMVKYGLPRVELDQEDSAIRPAAEALALARTRGAKELLYVHAEAPTGPPPAGAVRFLYDGRAIDWYELR